MAAVLADVVVARVVVCFRLTPFTIIWERAVAIKPNSRDVL